MTTAQFLKLLNDVKDKSSLLTDQQKQYFLNKLIDFQLGEMNRLLNIPETSEERRQILERVEFTLVCINYTIDLALKN